MKATSNEMIVRATGTFTLCASQIWTPEMEEKLCRSDAQRQAMAYGHGFTRIISPTGRVIAKMEHDAEGVLVADIDLGRIPVAKYFMDPAGHYSTPGNMRAFQWTRAARSPVFILGEEECPRASPTRTSSSKFSRVSATRRVRPRSSSRGIGPRPPQFQLPWAPRAHQNHLDKFPNDYCHIPRELMRKYFQKVESLSPLVPNAAIARRIFPIRSVSASDRRRSMAARPS